ncbi:MAG: S8 family serine peptidase [Caldilineaceae bacterium]
MIAITVLGLSTLLPLASSVTAQDAPNADTSSPAAQSMVGNTLFLPLVAVDETPVEVMTGIKANSGDNSPDRSDVGERSSYIVIMDLKPMIAYEGDVPGYALTKPAKGGKMNPNSREAQRYAQFLQQSHDNVLRAVGASADSKVNEYFYALNGFSATLTANQAAEMAKQPGVVSVLADEMRYKMTDNSPTFLGLNTRGGPWTRGINGEGVIVGIIDSGIWPEHPSFADDGSYGPSPVDPVPCEFGNTAHNANDAPFTCNNKLLGARQSLGTYRTVIGADPDEFDSARDDDGHGTHTASTAAGNADVRASIFDIRRGKVSGIAPRARIIAYKGLGKQGGFSSDLAAAIDLAVADGVDVINYSIGSSSAAVGADDVAFLFAADAGVFVATSAGNSGPNPATIGSPASVPWLTTVGASTQSRAFISDIRLRGPGRAPEDIWGGSITDGVRNYNLVDAEGIADTTGDTSGMCLNPFPTGTFKANDVVLCNQYNFGVARTDRVTNVKNAGGGAVIFHNSPSVSVMPTDNHPLPTVHVLNDVGQPLKDYLVANRGRVKVTFTQGRARYAEDDERVIPYAMASFSSRGPDPLSLDLIKPDVTAPGVNILAGASPIHNGSGAQGQLFQSIMGTSMSSPHVAGLFALLKQAHPEWSPAMAKSALMTTANQGVVKQDFVTPADPFDMGAGHVNVGGKDRKGSAFEPGLAYDAGLFEYAAFTCGADIGVFSQGSCNFLASLGIPFDASDLNLPSIGIADLAGAQTVVRTVTSVAKGQESRTYNVSVKAPPGYRVTVEPSSIQLKPGDTATYAVTIVNESAAIGEWRFGSLKWRDKSKEYEVYSPIAVRAALFDAPAQVDASGESGSARFDMSFGYSGAYAAAAHGLEPAIVTADVVAQDPDQNFDPADGFSNLHQFNLTGAAHFRIAMPPEAVANPDIDIDIYVFDPDGNIAAASTNGGTDELIDIASPQDGTWSVYIHGWQTVGGSAAYDMYSWIISATPGGNLTIDSAPAAAAIGQIGTVNVSWSGATAGQWHLGAVSHTGDAGLMGLTLVNVDNR